MTAGISLISGKTGAHRAPLQFFRSLLMVLLTAELDLARPDLACRLH